MSSKLFVTCVYEKRTNDLVWAAGRWFCRLCRSGIPQASPWNGRDAFWLLSEEDSRTVEPPISMCTVA